MKSQQVEQPSDPADHKPRARRQTAIVRRILQEAERLVGRHGVDGVSLRQVTLAAGAGNNSAIAYHFGDFNGLLRGVSEWRLPVFEEAAARLYAEAEQAGKLDDPQTIIRILAEPHLAIRDESGGHPHVAFVREMLRTAEGRAIRLAVHGRSSLVPRLLARLVEACPQVPPGLLHYRQLLASIAFYDAVVARDRGFADSECRNMSERQFFAELYDMMTAICVRPPAG